jgi:hypothetical protein
MGWLKKLKKKLTIKAVMKVAPVALALVPGVGTVVAGAVALAGKVAGDLKKTQARAEDVQDVLRGGPAPSIGPPPGPSAIGLGSGFMKIVIAVAALFLLPKLFGGKR